MKNLADRIKEERGRLGLNQEELAKLIGKGQSFIGNLESGLRKETALFPELAQVFGVSAMWLKTGKGDRTTSQAPQTKGVGEPDGRGYAVIRRARIQLLIQVAEKIDDSGLDRLIERATVLAETYPAESQKSQAA